MVCRVHAAADDSLNWDVCNAKSSNRTPIYQQELFAGNDKTRPEPNLNQLFLTEFANYQEIGGNYADADQSYLITFRPAHVVDGSAALNAWGGGPFDGTDIRTSTKREFVICKYTVADRTCGWWLVDKWNSDGTKNAVQVISDASGQAVNRYGGTTAKPTQLFMWHDGYDTDTHKNKASEWVIEEVPFTGRLELNSGAEEITWPQAPTCGDPFATCYPAKKELWETMGKPTAMIYRWYAAKTPDPAPDEDAVVMGQARISKTGDFMEIPAYRHVGTNFNRTTCSRRSDSTSRERVMRDLSGAWRFPATAGRGLTPAPTASGSVKAAPACAGARSRSGSRVRSHVTTTSRFARSKVMCRGVELM